jgi:taurine dioxygenase
MMLMDTEIKVSSITPSIGAVIEGVDLARPLEPGAIQKVREVWLARGVVFFRDQEMTEEQLEAFVAQFGKPITEPSNAAYGADPNAPPVHSGDTALVSKRVAERWHADATWLAEPPMATALRMVEIPSVGGDTCWANIADACEALFKPLRTMLEELTAIHWMLPSLEAMSLSAHSDDVVYTHPVVTIHPETGRKCLYVSEGWTRAIVELPPAQSVHLLALLYDHIKSPMFTMRWRWRPGDVAFWDNRTVQHFAVPDYDRGRIIQRVVLKGHHPYGPGKTA